MNVLLLSSRFPWPAYSGDRLRATIWLEALREANVALVAPPPDAGSSELLGFLGVPRGGGAPRSSEELRGTEELPHRFYPAKRSLTHGACAVVRTVRERLPWQSLLAAPHDWNGAIAKARADFGSFDTTIVILSRLHPWIPAAEGMRILDAIDSLARNMNERARAAPPWTRWIWRAEEKRTARAEEGIARAYDRVLYVSDDETGAHGVAVSNGVRIRPLESRTRKYDFGFWGRLAYFANADAARWLVDEIWPAIRAIRPGATLVIAGADAPAKLRRAAESQGITLLSPADDIPALARDIRVAILPLRYGSGESTKMLEAAEAGCAVVATGRGVRGLPELAKHATIAEDAQALAREAVGALTEADTELRRLVVQHYAREATLEKLRALVRKEAA
ncbi:MAG TPA: glycosyltransferase [Thermoanaerobaculia bacterium]